MAQSHHPHLILVHRKWREHLLALAPSLGTSALPHTLPPWRASGYKCCCSLASAPKGKVALQMLQGHFPKTAVQWLSS